MSTCYHCQKDLPPDLRVYRDTECPHCKRDVKVCRNCQYYAPGSHWDCRESISDQVVDKERANFCDWFRLGTAKGGNAGDKSKQARQGFAALFGETGED